MKRRLTIRNKMLFCSMLILLALIPNLTFAVNANGVGVASQEDISNYADLCNDFYINREMYAVYDKNDNDISESYYADTKEWFESNNIDAIFEYSVENVSCMTKTEIENEMQTRGSLQTVKETATFYAVVDNKTGINDFEIAYTLTGRITYNVNTGEIVSHSNGVFNLTYVSLNGLVSASAADISTSGKIVSNGYKVKFSCSFYIISELSAPAGSAEVVVRKEKTGPYGDYFLLYGT